MSRIVKISIGVALLIIVATLATPKLLSTDYVKSRIVGQISQITGRTVSLDGNSSISLRPYLGVTYENVTLGVPISGSADKPLVTVERLRAKLGLMAAFWGDAQIAEIHLVRPRFNLLIDQNGQPNWTVEKGPLAERFALKPEEEAESLALGKLTIEDGIAELNNVKDRRTTTLTAINGEINWEDVTSAADMNVTAVWRGEVTNIEAQVDAPLMLIRGGTSELTLSLTSKPITASFEGELDGNAVSAKGSLTAESPSPSRASEWLGKPFAVVESFGTSSLSGPVFATPAQMEFPEVELKIGEHSANGRMLFELNENSLPQLSGTLAFQSMTLPNFTELTAIGNGANGGSGSLDFSFLKGFGLDMRLSADTAASLPLELSNIAAALIVRDGKANFDIGQAETLEGTISGSVSLEAQESDAAIAADLAFMDINLGQLSTLYGEGKVSIDGTGDATFKLKSTGDTAENLLLRMNGEGTISGSDGQLIGLNLAEIQANAQNNDENGIPDFIGETSYDSLKLTFFVANGTAFMRGSEMSNEDISITLGGRADIAKHSLALRGVISKLPDTAETKLPFFVGGTSAAPLFVPLPIPQKLPDHESDNN